MTVTTYFDQSNLRFECRLTCRNHRSKQEIEKALDEYEQAIDIIVTKLDADGVYNFDIFILPSCQSQEVGFEIDYEQAESYFVDFWTSVSQLPDMRQRIKSVILKIEHALKQAALAGRSTDSLWHNDEVQFGEPLVAMLALNDLDFVEGYGRLMVQWDFDHEVMQFETINEIVQKHGICKETERLLFLRATECVGQSGVGQFEELYPILQNAYGDFTKSILFENIVSHYHSVYLTMLQEELELYKKRKKLDPSAKPKSLPKRILGVFEYIEHEKLKEAASMIFDKLDAVQPPSEFGFA